MARVQFSARARFFLLRSVQTCLGPTRPQIQWIPGALCFEAGGPPTIGSPLLLICHVHSYPPSMEDVFPSTTSERVMSWWQGFQEIRMMKSRMGRVCSKHWRKGMFTWFCGNFKRIEPLWRSRRRWVGIRMYVREIRWDGVNLINLVQSREQWRALVKTIMNILVP
jgi:hypothetical protein